MKICKVEECDGKIYVRGYCKRHYSQIRKHGKISRRTKYDKNEIYEENGIYFMRLYNNKNNIIAETVFDGSYINEIKQHKWYLTFYGYVKGGQKKYRLANFVKGDFSQKHIYDHRDRRPLNNLRSNLRVATPSQNTINRGIQSSKSGIVGVSWMSSRNKYRAYICLNKKHYHLGLFANIQDAITTRREAERKYHGEFSPNFKGEDRWRERNVQ